MRDCRGELAILELDLCRCTNTPKSFPRTGTLRPYCLTKKDQWVLVTYIHRDLIDLIDHLSIAHYMVIPRKINGLGSASSS